MPAENLYNFGLVRLNTLLPQDRCLETETLTRASLAAIYRGGLVSQLLHGRGRRTPLHRRGTTDRQYSSYCLGIWGFKASLLLSYMRFMPSGFYRIATITTGALVTMGHIAFLCVFMFICTPVSAVWDPAVTDGRCVAQVPFYLTFSALTIVFDLAV